MKNVVRVTLKDGLMLPSGFVAPAAYACVIFCRVPEDWLEGGTLKAERLETIFENQYGRTWRYGNEDGSRYVVQVVESRVLTPSEEESAPWRGVSDDGEYHYWFYNVSDAGELRKAQSSDF